MKENLGWTLEIAKHWWTGVHAVWCAPGQQPPTIPSGFHVLPRRWVVERTVAWFTRNRRLAKDYERLPETGETFLYMAMSSSIPSFYTIAKVSVITRDCCRILAYRLMRGVSLCSGMLGIRS